MSRLCGWCSSPRRDAWERRVLDGGESIQSVAADTPFAASAGHRHFRAHVSGTALAELRDGVITRPG